MNNKEDREEKGLKCGYCFKIFSSQSNLNNHIKTASYCIKSRPDFSTSNVQKHLFDCVYCEGKFKTKLGLNGHLEICSAKELYFKVVEPLKIQNEKLKAKNELNIKLKTEFKTELKNQKEFYEEKLKEQKESYENRLKDQKETYEKQIESLQNKLENIAIKASQKSSTTNNINTTNTINQILEKMPPITDDFILEAVKDLKEEDLKSPHAFAKFLYDNLFKGRLICTDPSRLTFYCNKLAKGIKKKFKDNNLTYLLPNICKAIENVQLKIIEEAFDRLDSRLENGEIDNELCMNNKFILEDSKFAIKQGKKGLDTRKKYLGKVKTKLAGNCTVDKVEDLYKDGNSNKISEEKSETFYSEYEDEFSYDSQ